MRGQGGAPTARQPHALTHPMPLPPSPSPPPGRHLDLRVRKRPGKEAEKLLPDADGGGEGDGAAAKEGGGGGLFSPKAGGGAGDKVVNVFTVASGHMYERLQKIMILSVIKNTKSRCARVGRGQRALGSQSPQSQKPARPDPSQFPSHHSTLPQTPPPHPNPPPHPLPPHPPASSSGSSPTTCPPSTAASSPRWRHSLGLTTPLSPTSGRTGCTSRPTSSASSGAGRAAPAARGRPACAAAALASGLEQSAS
jgi:hypothetical protein